MNNKWHGVLQVKGNNLHFTLELNRGFIIEKEFKFQTLEVAISREGKLQFLNIDGENIKEALDPIMLTLLEKDVYNYLLHQAEMKILSKITNELFNLEVALRFITIGVIGYDIYLGIEETENAHGFTKEYIASLNKKEYQDIIAELKQEYETDNNLIY